MPEVEELAEEWLRFAREDLESAVHMLVARDHNRPRQACFSAQQAAEKAIKAIFVAEQVDYPRSGLSTSVHLGSWREVVASSGPHAGVDYPRSFHELTSWFGDEEACLRYLERVRWGEGFVCRFCGAAGGDGWAVRRGMRRCAACRHESSATAGTIFHGSRLPLQSWFAAIWYVVNQKQGVSALGLLRVLGFGSYQTAWAWLHKLRRAMVLPGRELLAGAVEIDESYVGGSRPGKRGRGATGKAIVVIAVEDHDGHPGRTRMARVPDVKRDTLTDFVLDHVSRGAEVRTDAHHGYNDIGRHRFGHVVVNVKQSGDPAHVVMPHVHRVASLLKRWLLGTHQGAVTHGQLDYYLDEFTFRFNRRRSRHRGLLFYRLIEGALAADPHPYRALLTPRSAA